MDLACRLLGFDTSSENAELGVAFGTDQAGLQTHWAGTFLAGFSVAQMHAVRTGITGTCWFLGTFGLVPAWAYLGF